MPLQMLTLDHMSCLAIGFPYWVQQNTLRPLSQLLRFPNIGYKRILLGLSHPNIMNFGM
jgi:hypothetical protein